MDLKKAKALLAEYYEGKSSRVDEEFLIRFFNETEVPPEMEADRLYFIALSESAKEELPDQFDDLVLSRIQKKGSGEGRKKLLMNNLFAAVSGIAAALLLVAGSYFLIVQKGEVDYARFSEGYGIEDPQVAYDEARSALLFVSDVLNKGTRELGSISKLDDASRNLAMIGKFHQGIGEITAISIFDEAVAGIK